MASSVSQDVQSINYVVQQEIGTHVLKKSQLVHISILMFSIIFLEYFALVIVIYADPTNSKHITNPDPNPVNLV